ncbi:unnamed protein product [Schistosoma margrebowiei]|uniref:Uncharacterized protein n=1 Tax=Schistosoma margrebowiei TaxID=48269 RepID=A0A183M0F0_9TREM|nr:unnamed protein product [Schistosoma margrebowiei]
MNRLDSITIDRAQTKSQHYGSSLGNQSDGIRHFTSTSLIMRRRLTICIGDN